MWSEDKTGATKEFSNFQFFFFVNKMYANYLEVLMACKYLFWVYSGAMITQIMLSCADHISAIGKNPGEMAILCLIFTFFVFLKN